MSGRSALHKLRDADGQSQVGRAILNLFLDEDAASQHPLQQHQPAPALQRAPTIPNKRD